MEHHFLQSFRNYWRQYFAHDISANSKIIVAVSGGVDSIVLAFILHYLKLGIIIVHCNFHLRGEESDRDEKFVEQFAKNIGKTFICKHFDTIQFAKECKLSIEEAARELRYKWFRELAKTYGSKDFPLPIFVAHHANDNIETVLMNFFRGCGIAGLHGILPYKEGIYRPLLFAKRTEIIGYALHEGLIWVEDSSNKEEKYTRNFLRNSIIPELKESFATVESNILDNIDRFREIENIYTVYIQQVSERLLQKKNNVYQIDIDQLKRQISLSTIIFELFKDFGFSSNQTSEIVKLLDAKVGSRLQSDTYTLWKDRNLLILSPNMEEEENIVWNNIDEVLELPDGTILATSKDVDKATYSHEYFDVEKFVFPLVVRHWREGDYFYPSGMNGKKKLAKFFIDLKVPVPLKKKIWLLTSENNIVWIIGYRADGRFVSNNDKQQQKIIYFRHSS